MNHMEDAFADEVLAEIGRQRGVTAKDVYTRAGISQSTWGNYFVQRTTRIPLRAMIDVSDALGVLPEEMMRRARVHAEELAARRPPAEVVEAALSDMSPESQAALREARRSMGHDPEPDADPGQAVNG